jgi:23S rRNA (adenine2503-C2)-methyltransferase
MIDTLSTPLLPLLFMSMLNHPIHELKSRLQNYPAWSARKFSRSLLWQDEKTIQELSHFSQKTKESFQAELQINRKLPLTFFESKDGTVKFLMTMHDGLKIETVLIPFYKRETLCLSTQVGCGMNCDFCYTGKMGFKRSLTASEMLSQYLTAVSWLKEHERFKLLPAVVFMGQGEPLIPFEELKTCISWMTDSWGLDLSPRQITVSTVGHIPHLKRFGELGGVNLAFSLHSPFESERSKIIPMNETWKLSEVLKVLDEVPLKKRQYLICEYLLLKNFNMSDEHIEELTRLLLSRKAILNLIPFNPYPGSTYSRPDDGEIETFRKKLADKKIPVMVRTTKGSDVLAACGQLHTKVTT